MRTHGFRLQSVLAGSAVGAGLLAVPIDAKAADPLLALMQGKWTAALVGNTGCGTESVLATFTLDANGIGAGTAAVRTHSTGCADKLVKRQDFSIDSLDANGSGTAHLTCGAGCGWAFNIQVAETGKIFILANVVNFQNTPTGTAIHQVE